MHKIIDVGCAIIEKKGQLLIAQRKDDVFLGGCWEFPGGKREDGETFEQCVEREVKEELGIEIRARSFLERSVHTYPEKTVALHFYLCDWVSGEPQKIECNDFKWLFPNDLGDYEFPEGDEKMITDLIRNQSEYFGN